RAHGIQRGRRGEGDAYGAHRVAGHRLHGRDEHGRGASAGGGGASDRGQSVGGAALAGDRGGRVHGVALERTPAGGLGHRGADRVGEPALRRGSQVGASRADGGGAG